MNKEQMEMWKDGVFEHCQTVSTVMNDRKIIRKMMVDHLSQFFDWDDIEFDEEFNSITMLWKYGVDPVIRLDIIRDLGMDFIISHKFHKDMGDGVTITVYPFGLPKEGEIVES